MSTLAQLKTNVAIDLGDSSKVHYLDADIGTAIQNAYDDIAIYTRCRLKNTTINWQDNLSYYNFRDLGVSDYFAPIAIYCNNQNRFLFDDKTLLDFANFRNDWELQTGTPEYWTPASFERVAIYPRHATATSDFILYYAAIADTLTDSDTPEIAVDMQRLLEIYARAELLERTKEFTKALVLWEIYYTDIEDYKDRCDSLARTDLVLRA
jgi:hypothetical protein|tara:strand:+ start:584 stop:1210 length:627 start_codon:yes stop_codon:yes gene_type:complete